MKAKPRQTVKRRYLESPTRKGLLEALTDLSRKVPKQRGGKLCIWTNRIGSNGELDSVHPDFRLQAAEEQWQLRADGDQLSDVDAEIWENYLKMQDRLRKADQPSREGNDDLVRAAAIYAAQILKSENKIGNASVYTLAHKLIAKAKAENAYFAMRVRLPDARSLGEWCKRKKAKDLFPPPSHYVDAFLALSMSPEELPKRSR